MKKVTLNYFLLAFAGIMSFMPESTALGASMKKDVPKAITGKDKTRVALRKFQILVENERNIKKVQDTNNRLLALQETSRDEARRGLFGELLWSGYTSAFT